MLNENIRKLRKAKGLSQEELAMKLNVVRQTVSKWEKGLSVPDSEMLIKLAEELDTTVNNLLGERSEMEENSELKIIAAKLELLNEQFAKQNEAHRRTKRIVSVVFCVISSVVLFAEFFTWFAVYLINRTPDTSIAIIGGSDGPTQILVAEPTINPIVVVAAVIVIILSVSGIFRTKKGIHLLSEINPQFLLFYLSTPSRIALSFSSIALTDSRSPSDAASDLSFLLSRSSAYIRSFFLP